MKSKLPLLLSLTLIVSISLIMGCNLFKSSSHKDDYFPIFEVEADNYYDLGFAIGQRFAENIQEAIIRQAELSAIIANIISVDSVYFYENLLAKAEELYPDLIDEIRGMSDGSGVEFEKIGRAHV